MTPAEIIAYINATPELQSLLYDLDLLPEQIQDSQHDRQDQMQDIVEHFKRFEERLTK